MTEKILTQSMADNYPARAKKLRLHDAGQPGLFLEIRPSGGRTYYVRYKSPRGKWQEHRLGNAADLKLTQARQLANETRASALMGVDPKEAQLELQSIPTFDAFFNEQYIPLKTLSKKSFTTDISLYRNHIKKFIGHLHLDQISAKHIQEIVMARKKAGAAAGTINRTIVLMRAIFAYALRIDTPGVKKNVAKDVETVPNHSKKERFLQDHELAPLRDALEVSENPMLKYIVLGLIVTGARKREILDAKWEDLNFTSGKWKIPNTKNGEPRELPINEGFRIVLAKLKYEQPGLTENPYVFPNPKTGMPFISIYYSWDTARRQAGLHDLRMHDLRHSFASFLINGGRTLYEVQHLLGHKSSRMTQRYAHLTDKTLREASNSIIGSISGLMTFEPPTASVTYATAS